MGKKSREVNRQKECSTPPVAAAAPGNTATSNQLPPPTFLRKECWVCLDGDPDDEGKLIVRDFSCRGNDTGFAHISCIISYADRKTRVG